MIQAVIPDFDFLKDTVDLIDPFVTILYEMHCLLILVFSLLTDNG